MGWGGTEEDVLCELIQSFCRVLNKVCEIQPEVDKILVDDQKRTFRNVVIRLIRYLYPDLSTCIVPCIVG